MMSGPISIESVKKVAQGLKPLLDELVFVGGAVAELYADDEAAPPPRPTTDVDVVVKLIGYSDYVKLQKKLQGLGFYPDNESGIICRYNYEEIAVDIMPTDEKIVGFSNRWYKVGTEHVLEHRLTKNLSIKLFDIPYFLAAKLEAFNGRGGDPRASHDFEDVIYFLDNRKNWVQEVLKAKSEVKSYLSDEFVKLLKDENHIEHISVHLPYGNRKGRSDRLIEGMEKIIAD